MEKPKPLAVGDLIFTQEFKKNSGRKSDRFKVKGHVFAIALGQLPPFAKDPPAEHLFRLMGTIGFLRFDEVADFLGDEMAKTCVEKFEAKYYGRPLTPEEQAALDVAENIEPTKPEGNKIVGLNGTPLKLANPPVDGPSS